MKGYSKATITRYAFVIRNFIAISGITDLSQVNEDNVRNMFYIGRTERKWSVNTYIVYHKSLLVFFRWCVQNKFLLENPVERIEKPKLEKLLPPKLTKQDALRLLDVVSNYPYHNNFLRYRNHAIFAVFIFAGLRKQELLKLKLTDIDLVNFSLFIKQGKGNKDRIIPISFTLATILQKYLDERKRAKKKNIELFCSWAGNNAYTESSLKRLVELAKASSGIHFSVHKLRHTFATLMLEGGCDIFSLSRMMGHSDIKTTTIYLHATVEHLQGEMRKHPLNHFIHA